MTPGKRKIAIVGGGIAGIMSIAMLKEEGQEPICFEKTDKPGGTWCYREKTMVGNGTLMTTTTLNHSKEMGALSNFPPKKEYNNFMRHREFYQYLTEYMNHNDCERHIRYNSEVILVKMADDYEQTGRWLVTFKETVTGKVSTDLFDNVIIGNGHFGYPNMPTYPKMESFRGKIMHVHELKDATGFKGQKVLVVGIGCSALDAAVELSNVAEQVYISTRTGAYILNRVGPNGYPLDYTLYRRYITMFLDILPVNLCSWYIETFYLDPRFDHRLYAVQPKYHVMAKDPIFSDVIGAKLISGAVVLKPDIVCFAEDGVIFSEENEVTEVDTVIMATGYKSKFPFLDKGILIKEDGRINLYKCIFPTQLSHPTLAFVAFINPYGPGFPPVEMQTRYVAHIFSGKGKLPSEAKMIEDVKKRYETNIRRYAPSDIMNIRVDFVQYTDELAVELGVKPNFLRLFFTDISLFFRLFLGPSLSYQYRLQGPHKWDGAREAIMTCDERIFWGYCKGKKTPKRFFQIVVEYIINLVPTNFYLLRA